MHTANSADSKSISISPINNRFDVCALRPPLRSDDTQKRTRARTRARARDRAQVRDPKTTARPKPGPARCAMAMACAGVPVHSCRHIVHRRGGADEMTTGLAARFLCVCVLISGNKSKCCRRRIESSERSIQVGIRCIHRSDMNDAAAMRCKALVIVARLHSDQQWARRIDLAG